MTSPSLPPLPSSSPCSEQEAEELILTLSFLEKEIQITIKREEDSSPIYEKEISLDYPSSVSLSQQISDFIYASPFLTFNYKKVFIRFSASDILAIPSTLSDEEKNAYWLATIGKSSTDSYLGSFGVSPLAEVLLLTSWDKESYNFLRRTYIGSIVETLSATALSKAYKESLRERGRVAYLLLDSSFLELIFFYRGELLFFNRFERLPFADLPERARMIQQILFYWSAMCKAHSIDSVVGDSLKIVLPQESFSNKDFRQELEEGLNETFASMGVNLSYLAYTTL